MIKIDIKPLSTNKAWKGKRFKTDAYKNFETIMMWMLPNMNVSKKSPLHIHFQFGFSSKGSDLDNPIKQTIDCLQKKYGFNDNQIYRMVVDKFIVKKGKEFIKFEITELK
jgi:Holliday junction resolvase RusA-like endonuclease